MKRIFILLLVVGTMMGCANTFSEEEGYRISLINYSFPIPKNAGELKPEACTDEITKSAKYKLKNIGGENHEGPQTHYLNEIHEWGWTPIDEESSELVRYFSKEDKTVCVVFSKHVIDVFEINKDATSNENP
ncbi:hypothetical protein JSQ81_10400 [Sporosarcina sp. Marseille-Q4063]|uniref:hypothetical protein n=1 Tax=Sporosarcina sp. Marseille-Q4063 TaxID=2810514 RepID=UPI001BAF5E8F|nr:hypothetical protein [Sporosarcina sp. Marseille-Q4063]QUW20290.1 hypothetical protein JSQ81_10400 [Sporosarcina sp. Marseille-Q4063]